VIDRALAEIPAAGPTICLSPRGPRLDQARVASIAAGPGVRLLCGRFEGIDQRVIDAYQIEELSLGDFVLSGGEPAAIALLDACIRLLPGVVGDAATLEEESFQQGLLEYPHYTRPQEWQGRAVPEVLLSGHHENIRRWRMAEAERVTRERRPDLWQRYTASLKRI
jgi:tRNA (guanine37-N1)-methyltransferase